MWMSVLSYLSYPVAVLSGILAMYLGLVTTSLHLAQAIVRMLAIIKVKFQNPCQNYVNLSERTWSVISSEPSCKEGNAWFTMVPLNPFVFVKYRDVGVNVSESACMISWKCRCALRREFSLNSTHHAAEFAWRVTWASTIHLSVHLSFKFHVKLNCLSIFESYMYVFTRTPFIEQKWLKISSK